jgi:hypothetical protein
MSQARVESLDVLKTFKVALVKFIESANAALIDAESDLVRTRLWIETEQQTYWQGQIKKRTELLARAEEALRMKKVFKDVTGARQSYVDEEKAVQKARRMLESAQHRYAATQQWKRRMEKIGHDYKGSVQRLSTTVASELPAAVSKIENMLRTLETYVATSPIEVTSTPESGGLAASVATSSEAGSMSRPVDEPEPPAEQSSEAQQSRTDKPEK